jgi:hypothetical protein
MMKRSLFVLSVLGFLFIFSTAAFAVDVKFSGEFFAAGMYLDRASLTTNPVANTAFYFQRLRLRTDIIVAPGLSLITRFDAMERSWGANRSTPGTTLVIDSAGTVAENQNIAFDWVYVDYVSPIGTFDVGYMNDSSTGTIFGNSLAPAPRIKYSYPLGPLTLNAAYTKVLDGSVNAGTGVSNTTPSGVTDADNDKYGLEAVYKWKNGLAGLNVNYYRYANTRPTADNQKTYFVYTPYAIAKFGPVDLQTEFNYAVGKLKAYDSTIGQDVRMENYSGWIDATATFGPVYFGGTVAYVSGDDPNTTDKQEGGTLTGGRDWSPALIMWSYDRSMWIGELASSATTGNGFGTSGLTNGLLYQGRIGVRPTDKLDIMASLTYATVDKKPKTGNVPAGAEYVDNSFGTEFDIMATYKITNNLTYMLGYGYLWTGDYFKGTNVTNIVQNDYMVINKLTLTF